MNFFRPSRDSSARSVFEKKVQELLLSLKIMEKNKSSEELKYLIDKTQGLLDVIWTHKKSENVNRSFQ